jgi:putative flippase GtrA
MNIFHLGYWTATFLGNLVGAVVSFILNRSFTFQSKSSIGGSSLKFIVVIFVSYIGAYAISDQIISLNYFQIDFRFISNKEASVLLGSCLYTLVNYFGQKYFVFTTSHGQTR